MSSTNGLRFQQNVEGQWLDYELVYAGESPTSDDVTLVVLVGVSHIQQQVRLAHVRCLRLLGRWIVDIKLPHSS